VIQAELPGVKKDAVKVTVQTGLLMIQGERRKEPQGFIAP
jgi:HSP20 family molecular chaperone IbpA